MADLNSVTLSGRITREAESPHPNILKLSLGNTRSKKKDGQWEDHSNFFDITVIGSDKQIAMFEGIFGKGTPFVGTNGELEFRKFTDKDGNNRSAVSVVYRANDVKLPDKGSDTKPATKSDIPVTPEETFGSKTADDNDIPF